MEAATLAQLLPGRLDIGIGMPSWLRSVDARPAQPLAALERHVREGRALLDGRAAGDGGVALDASAVLTVG